MKRALPFVFLMGWPWFAAADDRADCEVVDKYLELAAEAERAFKMRDAQTLLQNANDVCPSWQTWQRLGEVSAQLADADSAQVAANAFKQAYELPDITDEQRAQTASAFARLLLQADKNPKRAESWIFHALSYAPEDEEIRALAAKIEAAGANPTQDQIVRGFFSDIADRGPRIITHQPAERSAIRVNYALNFYTNSFELYPESLAVVDNLARTMSNEAQFADKRFSFVGHTDERGSSTHNMQLSMQRAQKVRDLVVERSPSLSGQINVEGRGESELRDLRLTDEAHRRNRRVEIWMQR